MKTSAPSPPYKSINLTNFFSSMQRGKDLRNFINGKKVQPTQGMTEHRTVEIQNSAGNSFREPNLVVKSTPNSFRERPTIFPSVLDIDLATIPQKSSGKKIATAFNVIESKIFSIGKALVKIHRDEITEDEVGEEPNSSLSAIKKNELIFNRIERDFRNGCVFCPNESVRAANLELELFKNEKAAEFDRFRNEKEAEIGELKQHHAQVLKSSVEKSELLEKMLQNCQKSLEYHEMKGGNSENLTETTTQMDTEEMQKQPQSTPAKKHRQTPPVKQHYPDQYSANVDLTAIHENIDQETGLTVYACTKTLMRNAKNNPQLAENFKNPLPFACSDFRQGLNQKQIDEQVKYAKPPRKQRKRDGPSEKVLIITDSQGTRFEEFIKSEYNNIADVHAIGGLLIDQGRKGKNGTNLMNILERTDTFKKNISYDGIILWAGGNDASDKNKTKNKWFSNYVNPEILHNQVSVFFQVCAKKWPNAKQCFIGIPPRRDVQQRDIEMQREFMIEWVDRAADGSRWFWDLLDGVKMESSIHVDGKCVRSKNVLVKAIKKCVF